MGAATAEAPAEPIPGQTDLMEPTFEKGPVGRLEKKAYDKDLKVARCEEEGDEEGADIERVEADALREEAADLKAKLGEEAGDAEEDEAAAAARAEAEETAAESDALPEDIVVAGLEIKPMSVGGKVPTSGTLKLTGGKVKLLQGTFLKKGTVIHFSGTAVVNDVGAKDLHDSATQQVVDAVQNHAARITALSVDVPE